MNKFGYFSINIVIKIKSFYGTLTLEEVLLNILQKKKLTGFLKIIDCLIYHL